jgi:hypothetical protein
LWFCGGDMVLPRLIGLELRPSGFDPTRRVHGSGLQHHNRLLKKGKNVYRCKCYVSPNG